MIPTETIIAMAVESAPTSTEVRLSDAARLREAKNPSTPSNFPNNLALASEMKFTVAGLANAMPQLAGS
jgi:hypothetical protein